MVGDKATLRPGEPREAATVVGTIAGVASPPNTALHLTASSLRSYLAAASGGR
jgi:hypothetical protein